MDDQRSRQNGFYLRANGRLRDDYAENVENNTMRTTVEKRPVTQCKKIEQNAF